MKIISLACITLFLGCTVNLNLDNEYAVNSGDGSISESQTVEETAETIPDISANLDGAL
ncbi:hypothetical protein [Vibrio harveyi]|uniref:hypothetical protein n=1 Tax=Vibrio harveyi TaxID=669 RepID=UPI00217EC7E8|nr:hypothetical protein [Vibrio harveyi]